MSCQCSRSSSIACVCTREPGAVSEDACAALHAACQLGCTRAVSRLLASGDVSVDARDAVRGWTPLHTASRWERVDVMDVLLAHGSNVSAGAGVHHATPLHVVHSYWGARAASRLIAAGAPLEARDARGYTPLHAAADRGHLHAVRALVEAGADVGACTADGSMTPLHLAVRGGHTCVAAFLERVQTHA